MRCVQWRCARGGASGHPDVSSLSSLHGSGGSLGAHEPRPPGLDRGPTAAAGSSRTRCGTKHFREPERGGRCDTATPVDERVHPLIWHVDAFGQITLREPEWLQELPSPAKADPVLLIDPDDGLTVAVAVRGHRAGLLGVAPREHHRGASLCGRRHRPARCGCLTSISPMD